MVSISLFQLIVFVLIDSVICVTLNSKFNVEKSVEDQYPYHHPPAAEYYNPIPVAVVYEDDNVFSRNAEVKLISDTFENKKDIHNEDLMTVTKKDDENISIENIASINVTSKSQTKPEIRPKSRSLSDYQIPVAVIYDKDPYTYQTNRRTKTDVTSETPKLRSGYTQEITKLSKEKQTTITEKNNKPLNADTKIFEKRTEKRDPIVPIIDMESYIFSHSGKFRYSYEGGDGTKAYSEGKQITIDKEPGEAVIGGFSYKDKDGNDISLTYTADENGYRPVGDHLPTPPPIPPAIARALAYLATATPEPVTKPPGKFKAN